jgi:alpha-beta hydrolase superfamily lysophospholipase
LRFIRPALPVWLIAAAGCASAPVPPADIRTPAIEPDLTAFEQGWEDYLAAQPMLKLQEYCRPQRISPATDTPRRGAVVMYHGFGGCPQQLFELAGHLAARGYEVLLPRLPGHGYDIMPGDEEDLSLLPTGADWETRYSGLARRMNNIMATSPGERAIAGFSLGGTMSINAVLWAPGLYDRMLLLGPLIAIRGGAFVEGISGLLGRTPGIRNIKVKSSAARKKCRDWQKMGRDGFCDYRFKHVVALIKLEKQNRHMYRQAPITLPLQIIAAGDEKYVSNEKIIEFTENQRANGPVGLCFLPDDVPHEMLTPFENEGKQMYWLAALLKGVTDFIVSGTQFPVQPADEPDNIRQICRTVRLATDSNNEN